MNLKKCCHCKKELPFNEFCPSKTGKYGLHNHCRGCKKILRRAWYVKKGMTAEQKEKQRKYGLSAEGIAARKKFYASNTAAILKRSRERRRKPEVKRLTNITRNKRYHSDPLFRIAVNLRSRVRAALNGLSKSAPTLKLIGCSLEELRTHLEQKFLTGMTWENYGTKGWHIDHIIPCSSFDLSKEDQLKKCFNWSNMQPLWWLDNLSKGSN